MQVEKSLEENKNPLNWIADTDKTFAKAQEFEPDEYELTGLKARLEVAKARNAANQHKNPLPYFEQADRLFAKTLKLNPCPGNYFGNGAAGLLRGKMAVVIKHESKGCNRTWFEKY